MSEGAHDPCGTYGICCRAYLVPVCGRDVWEISRRQHLDPESFVVAVPQPKQMFSTFKLDEAGFAYSLALDKKRQFEPNSACIFLVELGGGHSRCGIYSHRPVVCHAYPMEMFRDVVFKRRDSRCPPNAWPDGEPRRPSWRVKVQRNHLHFDIYSEVATRWNERVARSPRGTAFTFTAYLNYPLNVYERLAVLEHEVGEETLRLVEANWSAMPENGDLTDPNLDRSRFPWLSYLGACREIIDRFYPEIEPLPSASLMRAAARRERWSDDAEMPEELRADLHPSQAVGSS
jgi:Fe-S-cluster containining protein